MRSTASADGSSRGWEDGTVTDPLVRVLTTPSIPEGEIAKARLESEGIPVLLKGEAEGPYRMGPIHLLVPADLEVQARLVLSARFEDAEEDVDIDDVEIDDIESRNGGRSGSIGEPDGSDAR
jgi:Putative prokaryotic signal transducing protein